MKIKTKGLFGKDQTDYIENIFENDPSTIGRLVQVLAKNGQLSAEEVYFIAKGYDGTAEFVEQ